MVVVDLFAGGGGSSTGLRAAELRHAACVELDPHAVHVARALGLPSVRADVGALPLDLRPDLVWASPPCQCFSAAGKRRGASDERNGFPAMLAAVDRLRPTWLLVENVPGLTYHRRAVCPDDARCPGCYWERVVLPTARERFGCVEARVLNAADWGVPQTRHRVILACGPSPFPWPAPTHAEYPEATLFAAALPRWRTMRDALGCELAIGAGTNPHGPCREHERTRRDITDEPSPTVTNAQVGNRGPWIVDSGSNGKPGRERARTLDEPSATVSGRGNAVLRTECDPAYTVVDESTSRVSSCHCSVQSQAKRRLTPAECALIQGWPEVISALEGLTSSAAYRVVGNAVPPALAEALGRALLEAGR